MKRFYGNITTTHHASFQRASFSKIVAIAVYFTCYKSHSFALVILLRSADMEHFQHHDSGKPLFFNVA